jgi:hypothetical protein
LTRTTIQVDAKTVDRLKSKKIIPQESFDVELNRLLDELEGRRA